MADTEYLKQFLMKFIGEYFPGVEPVVSVEESCMYTMTPDENPVIDTVPGTNIVIGVGFSGNNRNAIIIHCILEHYSNHDRSKEMETLPKSKYTIRSIVCEVRSILSSCQPISLSSCHPVNLSAYNPVILSSCHPIFLSSCLSVFLSSSHPVIQSNHTHFQCYDKLTD